MASTGIGRFGRGDRSALSLWFWELDRVLLGLVLALFAVGLIAVAAGSPVGAAKHSTEAEVLDPLHYFHRQLAFVVLGVPLMLVVSMLPVQAARRLALIGGAAFLALLFLTPVLGNTVNGARRWIGPGIASVQPAEFLKPFFAVSMAWLLSLGARDETLPMKAIVTAFTILVAALLMMQPDFGQTMIFAGTWFVLMLLAGAPARAMLGLVAAAPALVGLAYLTYGNARERIDQWIGGGEQYDQVMLAFRTLTAGGVLGAGPGLGSEKFALPEAHTDYILSVVGEEFGLIACLAIAMLYLTIVARVCLRLLDEEECFLILAVGALVAQFGGQAFINVAVNLRLFPSKGMTLPLISYGGSSILALSIGLGLLLAFTRRNPYLDRSRYRSEWDVARA